MRKINQHLLCKKTGFLLAPMAFMNIMAVWALVLLLIQYKTTIVGIIAAVLLALAVTVIIESLRTVMKLKPSAVQAGRVNE